MRSWLPFIGGGGLGDFIAVGISMMDMSRLLVGAIPIALLALTTEFTLGIAGKVFFAEIYRMINMEHVTKRFVRTDPPR